MAADIIQRMNWVDIFVIILLLKIIYTAMKNGIFIELFKFLGVISGIYLSLHYYTRLANFLDRFIKVEAVSIEILDFLSVLFLAVLGYVIFVSLREGMLRFVKIEVISILNKWAAVALGVIRGILLASLILYIFSLPMLTYLKVSVSNSYSGERLITLSPIVYTRIWDGFMSKFMPHEEFNKTVLKVQELK